MALDENTSPASATGAIRVTPKPISSPARARLSGVPLRSLPKKKSYPTTT